MPEEQEGYIPPEAEKVTPTKASNNWRNKAKSAAEFVAASMSTGATAPQLFDALNRHNYGEAIAWGIPTAYTTFRAMNAVGGFKHFK